MCSSNLGPRVLSAPLLLMLGNVLHRSEEAPVPQDTKCIIPDRCYAGIYKEMVLDCKANGAFDPSTMGNVANVGMTSSCALGCSEQKSPGSPSPWRWRRQGGTGTCVFVGALTHRQRQCSRAHGGVCHLFVDPAPRRRLALTHAADLLAAPRNLPPPRARCSCACSSVLLCPPEQV